MAMKRIMVLWLSVALVSLLAAAAGQEKSDLAASPKEVRDNIETLRLIRMTQALDLTEEQAAQVYPALSKMQKEKVEIIKRMGKEIRDLRELLKAAKPGEAELLAAAARIKEFRLELRGQDEEFEAFLEGHLTPLQRAKYALFNVEFYKRLGETLIRARGLRNRMKRIP